jgi:hypothetical protein
MGIRYLHIEISVEIKHRGAELMTTITGTVAMVT